MTRNEAAERLRESMRQKGYYYVDLLQDALAEERRRVDLPRTDREDEVFAAGYKEGFEAAIRARLSAEQPDTEAAE